MHKVSSAYKKAMNKPMRDRAYIQIGVGVVSQEAQGSAKLNGDFAYWSTPNNIFSDNKVENSYYATMENNYLKADGKMFFMPESADAYFYENGITTKSILSSIKVTFNDTYDLKGLTIDFGTYYPTKIQVINSSSEVHEYTLTSGKFVTTNNLGSTSYLIIKPLSMVGNQQRMRIMSMLMGVGLTFGNNNISKATYSEEISLVSAETSSNSLDVTILDPTGAYNVDNTNSFINFLQTGQQVTVSEGITIENGDVEWVQLGSLSLDSWSSKKGQMSFKAVDKFSQMDDEYTLGNKIYTRTAYQEAISILTDMGFEPDEYQVDDYLKDVTLTNPMPEGSHKECLQLLANACRCVCYQDFKGKIVIKSSFSLVVDPTDLTVSDNGHTAWSKPSNIRTGASVTYADMTQNFIPADGSFYFMPSTGSTYLETGYVSSAIADALGKFTTNPQLTISFPSATTYYGINLKFGGNAPQEIRVRTYYNNELVDTVDFTEIDKESVLFYDFETFDKMVFEFRKGYPNNRILVDAVSFGDFNDYVLSKTDCFSDVYGTKEVTTKSVSVKIFSFENDEEGNPKEIEDNEWYTHTMNTTGQNVLAENPLISTETMAKTLAEWLGLYYANNVSYDVDYRGEPRLNANDIIHMESDYLNNLQVAITSHKLDFNGAFKGSLSMRKAMTQQPTSE